MTAAWTGQRSRTARALIRSKGRYQSCWRCGRDLDLDVDKWHAGHVGDARVEGGKDTDVAAECPRCNLRDGGKLGNRRRQARAAVVRTINQRLVRW